MSIPFFSFYRQEKAQQDSSSDCRTHLLDGLFGIWLSLLGLFGDLLRGNRLALLD